MNLRTIMAALLVALGLAVPACSGIAFTTPGKPVEFLGLRFEKTETHYIPPAAGGVAVVAGLILLFRPKRTA